MEYTGKEFASDLEQSKNNNIDGIRSLCLFIGPYRNLTTLTASTLFLHPNCQVLNHAAERLLNRSEVDFIKRIEASVVDSFLKLAIDLSQGGVRGRFGGSITHSHAFDDKYTMKKVFDEQGGQLKKCEIRSVVWKDSLRISNHIRNNKVEPEKLCKTDARIRFLLPIRNPIHCALSHQKTDHPKLFNIAPEDVNFSNCIEAILKEIRWGIQLSKQLPEKVFYFFEEELSKNLFERLQKFLDVEESSDWVAHAVEVFRINPKAAISDECIQEYQQQVESIFADEPTVKAKLLNHIPA